MGSASVFLIDPTRRLLCEAVSDMIGRASPGALHRRLELERPATQFEGVSFLASYRDWCDEIEVALAETEAVVVWFMAPYSGAGADCSDLNMLQPGHTYGRLCAMLATTFPDVLFVRIEGLTDILEGFRLGALMLDPLFDGTGIRDRIRKAMRDGKSTAPAAGHVARRQQLALSLDEERPYAYLHAYAAYRFGFRAIPVETGALADHLLDSKKVLPDSAKAPRLTFEDLFVSFPDKQYGGNVHLSDLHDRATAWPGLAGPTERVFVTSGLQQGGDGAKQTRASNQKFLRELRLDNGKFIKTLHKPHAGVFRVWQDSQLDKRQFHGEEGGARGVGAGFVWPPPVRTDSATEPGHSADGTLLTVATRLLERADRIRCAEPRSVREAVRGAVFATDALELLGGKTPTASIDALRLKHECEVLAECQFSGVEYHIRIAPRLDEIRRDAKVISQWFHPSRQRNAVSNAEMKIVNSVMLIFRRFAQFDEEQICLNRIRRLRNQLWRAQHPVRMLAWPMQWYFEQILTSIPRFAGWIAFWIVVLAFLYAGPEGSLLQTDHMLVSLESAVSSFFSIGAPIAHGTPVPITSPLRALVICASIFLGFLHGGVFVSHVYSIAARK